MNNVDTLAATLQARLGGRSPRLALVLGSGLNFFAETTVKDAVAVPYEELPGFPRSTVEGHAGRFVAGTVDGVPLICMQGRFHYYEGYDLSEVTLPIRVLRALGVETLLLTNAAGGIRADFKPGDFMLIEDHINFMGVNPLRGPNDAALGLRFQDMTEAWDGELRQVALSVARTAGIALQRGVYLAVSGPSFETPAEIRAFRTLGADAVGMSTVPECIVARHAGMRVLGISCITNVAAAVDNEPLTHEEVGETASRVKEPFARLLAGIVRRLSH
ncbi:MAG: purine-nucleoside phosphorylase [Opitutales bacterium]